MSLLIAERIGHCYGAHEVLSGVSLRLGESDRVGLVGPNGEGKTTLLRILAGLLEPLSGKVHRTRDLGVGYLPQDPPALAGTNVGDACLEVFAEARSIEDQMHALSAQMAQRHDDRALLKRYDGLQGRFDALGGYDYAHRIEAVLTGLGFVGDLRTLSLGELSGGWRTRAYLATLLLARPQVLLLDEPTNHLDLEAVEWLESWLGTFTGALVVVSHDRWFLDHVTTQTWEVAGRSVTTYDAPYSRFLVLRAERRTELMRRFQAQQEYIDSTQEFIRRHIAGQRTREARGRRKRLERFLDTEAIARPAESRSISLTLPAAERTGDLVLRLRDLRVGFAPETPLLEVQDIDVLRGDRVAIVGPNGVGKTSLLRTVLGELPPLSGSVAVGANVVFGYLDQTHGQLDGEMTALESVREVDSSVTPEMARSLLGALLLSGDDALKKVGELSGGQRSRVVLARLVVQNANVLVLDEPTNHLDIPSTEIIQEVLERFDGTVIFVSHDRQLISKVARTIWVIDDGSIRELRGSWESYVRWRSQKQASAQTQSGRSEKEERRDEMRRARKAVNELQRLKRRHEEVESRIDVVERELKDLDGRITAASTGGDVERVQTLGIEYESKDRELQSLWSEWETLSEHMQERAR